MELTDKELEFVRSRMGEWEINDFEFEYPIYIPTSEIKEYFGITRQAVIQKAHRAGIEVRVVGGLAMFRLEDVLKHWFEALS